MRTRLLAATTLTLLTLGCGGDSNAPAEESAAPTVTSSLLDQLSPTQAEGKAIFETVCWTCHGTSGRGDGPTVLAGVTGAPPSFITGDYASMSQADLVKRFDAAFEGADPEHPHMRYVVDLLKPERFRAALSYIPVLAYPPNIPGSAMAGLHLYQDRCVSCHGEAGGGDGYAAHYLELVQPADFQTDSLVGSGDFQGLFARIKEGGQSVHGSAMPAWGLALDDDQVWDLVAYVSTFQAGVLPPLPAH